MKFESSFYDEKSEVQVLDLGLLPFQEAWKLQKDFLQKRICGDCPDTLLLVEHPPTITVGRGLQRGGQTHLSFSSVQARPGVEVIAIERGGQATYHGPGQLVLYPIFQLAKARESGARFRSRSGVVGLIRSMEEGVISFLKAEALEAVAIPERTGVWIRGAQDSRPPERKIASIGLAVKRWVSYHGLAFNYSTGLAPWRQLQPCGFGAEVMTDLTLETRKNWTRESLQSGLIKHLLTAFNARC